MRTKTGRTTILNLIISLLALNPPCIAEVQSNLDTLARDNTAFALDLYAKLAANRGNLILSPHGISTALGMTYAGARGNTEKQMAAALHFSLGHSELHPAFGQLAHRLKKAEQDGIQLSLANTMWPQQGYPFLDEFLSIAKQHYGVSITAVDYRNDRESARKTINHWVKDKTENRIPALIHSGDISDNTRLVLVNTIYFRGTWANRFKSTSTKSRPFHVLADKMVHVPMMTGDMECRYARTSDMQILELPYVGGNLSMVILLPKQIDGIQNIESMLSTNNLARWVDALSEQEVHVLLPRFKATCRFGLSDALTSMGMIDAFSDTKADFAGLDGHSGWLYIGGIIHAASIEVSEDGTEASAATAVAATESITPTFRADHPFIYLIRERQTGVVLFAGRLCDPSNTQE